MPESSSQSFTVEEVDSSMVSRPFTRECDPLSARRSEMPILIETPDVVSASRLAAMLAPVQCELFPSGRLSWRVQIDETGDLESVLQTVRDWLVHEDLATTDVVVDGGRRIAVSRTQD
jgi:hypothetical protein